MFVHVPKTGGSSLRDQLRRCTTLHRMEMAYGNSGDFLGMTPQEQTKIMVIQAHIGGWCAGVPGTRTPMRARTGHGHIGLNTHAPSH